VILWTRVSTKTPASLVTVKWEVARDTAFRRVVSRGETETGAARDFTLKLDVPGLAPATTYYYRFEALGERSPIGRTKTTAASGLARMRVAVASCSNLPFGFFNVYARIAARADLDAVLHLGDYIYEYANNHYGNRTEGDGTAFGRIPRPNKELITLADYRDRYAQYREDADCAEVHRQHPFIVVWDDHEFANNTWSGGAENHNSEDGDWPTRKAIAARAYSEWMPIRDVPGDRQLRIYRTFRFGDLADLIMLDTRITGRDEQVGGRDVAGQDDPHRSMMGAAQEQWLFNELRESKRAGTRWQVFGQQVMFTPQVPRNQPGSADSWEGYRGTRDRVFDAVQQIGLSNWAVLTGDVHTAWAYDIVRDPFSGEYDAAKGAGVVGVEIVTPAVTSPNGMGEGAARVERIAQIMKARPHVRFLDADRGYVVVDITAERLQADWWFVPSVTTRNSDERFGKGLVSEAGRPHFVATTTPTVGAGGYDPAP
jgi:alkaline phosphatase D